MSYSPKALHEGDIRKESGVSGSVPGVRPRRPGNGAKPCLSLEPGRPRPARFSNFPRPDRGVGTPAPGIFSQNHPSLFDIYRPVPAKIGEKRNGYACQEDTNNQEGIVKKTGMGTSVKLLVYNGQVFGLRQI